MDAASPARGKGVMGRDAGAYVPAGAWVDTLVSGTTSSADQTLTIGGPGIFAYRWRYFGQATWSAPVAIGEALFSRVNPSVRTAALELHNLAPGSYRIEVIGQDFAGQWQDESAPTLSSAWIICPPLFQALGVSSTADEDHDGLTNLQEYAFGLSMSQADVLSITPSIRGGREVSFTIPSTSCLPNHIGPSDMIYEIRTSTDLQNWTTVGQINHGVIGSANIVASTISNERRDIKVTLPVTSTRQFVTIRVTLE